MLAEHARRGMEALRLYEPLPFQQAYHESSFRETILMKATRAGGSIAGFVEDARAALGCDPFDKYPKKDGKIVCVGWGEGHIGRVIYRYLFRPGAFTIIRDLKTKQYRVFRPWPRDEKFNGMRGDAGREAEAEPAPPLIPKRRIKGKIAWTKRSHNIFAKVELDTGWEIYAANSAGDPEQFQGFDVNLYHIDEDIDRPGWYTEATSRTQRVGGFLRWTAMPHGRNTELISLVRRAQDQEGEPDQIAKLLTATMYDNPFLPKKSILENERIWKDMGEDVYRQRALGELTTDTVRVYPSFSRKIHDYRSFGHAVSKLLKDRAGQVPEGWCRYFSVDPGHAVCAVMFFAVPPPEMGDFIYLYEELYLKQCSAKIFADNVKKKAMDLPFQAFIIDAHGGRLTDFGTGLTPREQYSSELERVNVKSVETEYGFLSGSDIIDGRENALRNWLAIRPDGSTKLIVNVETCPNFCREMETFLKKFQEQGGVKVVVDEGNRRFNTHTIESVEYAAAHGCKFVTPPKSLVKMSWVDQMIAETASRRRNRLAQGGSSGVVLGPCGASK